jgi:hypothetical protein
MFFSRIRNITVSLLLATLAGGCAAPTTRLVLVHPSYAQVFCKINNCVKGEKGKMWTNMPAVLAPSGR